MTIDVQTRATTEGSRVAGIRTGPGARTWIALAVWSALLSGAHIWGRLVNEDHATKILTPPLMGRPDLHFTPAIVGPVAFAALVVWLAPKLAARLEWRTLMVVTALVAATWAVSIAATAGVSALSAPLEDRHDYLVNVDSVGSASAFVDGYVERLSSYSVHAQGHPPGMVIVLWSMHTVGLGGAVPAATLIITAGASAAAAALVALRAVAGEHRARRAAPFLALAPAAVWVATSADALFMGVSAWGVALLALGAKRGSHRYAFFGGLALGAALMLSYGVASLAVVAAAVVLVQRRARFLVAGGAGVIVVLGAFAAAGFWWFDGLAATLDLYNRGVASQRPYAFFVVANVAAFGLAVGPAAAVSLGRLRDVRTWAVSGAALVAVVSADLSGFSKGEVERIWLIFAPWVVIACSAFDFRRARGMLGLQAVVALAVQTGVRTPW